jgi:hypothetical protein
MSEIPRPGREEFTIQGSHILGETGIEVPYLVEGSYYVDEDGIIIPGTLERYIRLDPSEAYKRLPVLMQLGFLGLKQTVIRYSIIPHLQSYLNERHALG